MLVLGLASCKDHETTEGNKEAVLTTTVKQSEDAKPAIPTTKVEQFVDAKQKGLAEYQYIVKIGDQAPTFAADIATGGQVTPADLEGKVTIGYQARNQG